MAKFRFGLEGLLKARTHAERHKQRLLSEIVRQRVELEDALRRHQQNVADGKQSMRASLVGEINSAALRVQANASLAVMRRAQRTLLELAGVHKRLEAARRELVEAARDRRAIELLRERRMTAWRAAINRAETAAIDELSVQAAARKELEL